MQVPNLVYHGWKCIGSEPSLVINVPTETYKYDDPDEYRLEPIAEHVLSQFARSRREGEAQFHFIWPNTRVNVYAGTPNLSIGPLLPAGAERSTGFLDYFFAPDAEPGWVDELFEFDRQVGAEDRALVERVQKGVRSGLVAEGRLLGESEQLVARFQELVDRALSIRSEDISSRG